MHRHLPTTWLLFAALVLASCGGGNNDTPTPSTDSGSDAVTDAGFDGAPEDMPPGDDVAPPVDMPEEEMPPSTTLCSPCVDDAQCGAANRCLGLFEGEQSCGRACDDATPCPDDYFCAVVDQMTMERQCVPEALTCVDRCSDVECGDGEICDPITGECRRPLRLCETDCLVSSTCGDGPEDVCLSMPGTADERACLTGCDPEAETSECAPDYFCVSTSEDDPNAGVCFPFQGTCVDRCSGVDCPTGENCNQLTGECEPAQFGACDAGCTRHAQCAGQTDLCLDLGINEGAHCWLDCEDAPCPSGYDCRGLLGTTLRICIPTGNDCSLCEDNACFPDGVCDPVADTCELLPETCSDDAECQDGSLCDPVSSTCVEIGRP